MQRRRMRQGCVLTVIVLFALAVTMYIPAAYGAEKEDFTDTAALEGFLEGFMESKMQEHHVPGAALILIKDGEILFSKGFGYADLEQRVQVDPQETVFRAASVSKVFVTLALLKLQEQGIVGLNDSVAEYFPDEPVLQQRLNGVRIHHLLSHTEGFPSKDLGTFVRDPEGIPPLMETLRETLKAPVSQPGSVITYGSMGAVLAAALIEELYGAPFDQYMEENIFVPLGMRHSSFRQVLPERMAKKTAVTYLYENGSYQKSGFLYGTTPPSGGLSCTAGDLAAFLSLMMNEGTAEGQRILEPSSINAMIHSQFRGHPSLPGVTFGFFEQTENGQRLLVRDGSGYGVTSRLLYHPEDQWGLVYLQNIRGDALVDSLTESFLDYLYPQEAWKSQEDAPAGTDPKALAGTYRIVQYHRNCLKLGTYITGMILRIKPDDEKGLQLQVDGPGDIAGWGGFNKRAGLTPVAPLLYARDDTEGYVAFQTLEDGGVYLFSGNGYHSTYERISWYETPEAHLIAAMLFVVVFLFGIFRGVKTLRKSHQGRIQKAVHLFIGCAALLNLVFPIVIVVVGMLVQHEGFPLVVFGLPRLIRIALWTPVLTGGMAVTLLAGLAVWRVRSKGQGVPWVVWGMAVVLLLYVPYMMYWHLFPGLAI